MEQPPNQPPDCQDFSKVVATYITNVEKMKQLRKEMKTLRDAQDQLSGVIITYMETKDLDVCRINNGTECGELCTTTKKSKTSLKRDEQVLCIAEFLDSHHVEFEDGTPSTKADELYERLQKKRPQSEKKGLVLRKR